MYQLWLWRQLWWHSVLLIWYYKIDFFYKSRNNSCVKKKENTHNDYIICLLEWINQRVIFGAYRYRANSVSFMQVKSVQFACMTSDNFEPSRFFRTKNFTYTLISSSAEWRTETFFVQWKGILWVLFLEHRTRINVLFQASSPTMSNIGQKRFFFGRKLKGGVSRPPLLIK